VNLVWTYWVGCYTTCIWQLPVLRTYLPMPVVQYKCHTGTIKALTNDSKAKQLVAVKQHNQTWSCPIIKLSTIVGFK
jgi:hypothetical protein